MSSTRKAPFEALQRMAPQGEGTHDAHKFSILMLRCERKRASKHALHAEESSR